MEINDEILNNYFDGDMSVQDKTEIMKAVNNSPELKRKFESIRKAHELFTSLKADEVSSNFTSLVMSKLNLQKIRIRQQKRFLTVVVSFFGIIILTITGYILYNILISASQSTEPSSAITSLSNHVKDLSSLLFSKNGTTIIGSTLSFIMLVSGYFLFEFQKKNKKNTAV